MIETIYSNPTVLMHYGVPGMRWGHRKAYQPVNTGLTVSRNQNGESFIAPRVHPSSSGRIHGGGGRAISPRTTKSVGFEACSNLIVKHKRTATKSLGSKPGTSTGEKTVASWMDMVKV